MYSIHVDRVVVVLLAPELHIYSYLPGEPGEIHVDSPEVVYLGRCMSIVQGDKVTTASLFKDFIFYS